MTDTAPIALLFPGQGAQAVGMGADIYAKSTAARAVFDEADAALDFPLSKLILEGPESDLRRTENAQPAILVTSIAYMRALEERLGPIGGKARFMAGHSLGEYTALVAAGALDLPAGMRLVRRRGQLMQAAADATPSGMAALLGMKLEAAQQVCAETGAQVANVNSPEQIVIAGPKELLEKASSLAKERGARRVVPLEVSGAFHTEVMRAAQNGMDQALKDVAFYQPVVPIIANTTAKPIHTADDVRRELSTQLCGCVYWQQSVEYMVAQGVTRFIEIGPGKVLSGLAKRINKDVDAVSVGDLDAVTTLTVS